MLTFAPSAPVCKGCGVELTEANRVPGYRSCRECQRIKRSIRYARWYKKKRKDPDYIAHRAAYMQQWREKNRETYREHLRAKRLDQALERTRRTRIGTLSIVYRVACGDCAATMEASAHRESAAAALFRRAGWSKTVRAGWLCPTCKKQKGA